MAPKSSRKPKQRRRRNRRRNALLPRRPKQPLSAYTAFVRAYFKKNPCTNAKEGIREAAKAWKKLRGSEKRKYGRRSDKSKLEYQGAMEKWRRQKNALKLPASSYALFVKSTWENEEKKRQAEKRSFTQMSRHAAVLWENLGNAQKKLFQQAHEARATNYFGLMGQLRSGELNIAEIGEPEVEEGNMAAAEQGRGRGGRPRKQAQAVEAEAEDEEMSSDSENEEE